MVNHYTKDIFLRCKSLGLSDTWTYDLRTGKCVDELNTPSQSYIRSQLSHWTWSSWANIAFNHGKWWKNSAYKNSWYDCRSISVALCWVFREEVCVKKKKTYSSLKQKDSTRIIMHKNTFWLLFAVLCIYLTLVFCEEQQQVQQADGNDVDDLTRDLLKTDSTDLQEEARTRRRHRHHLCKFFHYNIQEGKFINVKQCRVKRILKS